MNAAFSYNVLSRAIRHATHVQSSLASGGKLATGRDDDGAYSLTDS